MNILRVTLIAAALVMMSSAALGQELCESLLELPLSDTSIDLATSLPAGNFDFDINRPGTGPQSHDNLPAFCRIAATLTPSSDSDIKIEVWMPTDDWNGKLLGVGNGNWAGSINYNAMALALRDGYATVSTDTGHAAASTDGSWALGHPEKVADFGWRSQHEMTVKAKALIRAFYGSEARLSYWNGCSTGGRQGYQAATRFPGDYDGIIAGAPANPRSGSNPWQLSVAKAIHGTPGGALTDGKLQAIHDAVLESCDALDGVEDGLLENPKLCRFDPNTLLCTAMETDSCLTARQVESVRALLGPGRFSNGEVYHPGLEPGSELGWLGTSGPAQFKPYAAAHLRFVVFKNPDWDWRTFDPDIVVPAARQAGKDIDVSSTDFSRFIARGGKMIIYHGWADPRPAPQGSINYFERVKATTPGAENSVRLFMVPGMGHCRGGEGPDNFDMLTPLEDWIENGNAPTRVIATRVENDRVIRSRPLCPYPQVARYLGRGSIDDEKNFACVIP